MNILLTNRSLKFRAGSEMWVVTMAHELAKNHSVDIFAPGGNSMIKDIGTYDPEKKYDLAIINHNTCLSVLKDNKNIKFKIFTCHGVLPKVEQPILGADAYVAVSEEVQVSMKAKGFKATVIRNPIDCELYKPTNPSNKELKNILYLSNRKPDLVLMSEAFCDYNFKNLGGGNSVSNVAEKINEADLVISLGRGIYEAMACGKNCIVYDRGKGDGFVTPETILEYRKHNCSGRKNAIKLDAAGLREWLKQYDHNLVSSLRAYALKNNNVEIIAKEYLALAGVKKEQVIEEDFEMLHTTGFSGRNYGAWMNKIMETSPSEWVVFTDHDAFLSNPNWYRIIKENIKKADNPGLLTCVTNRIGNPQQKVSVAQTNHDLMFHHSKALELESSGVLKEATRPISGIMMVTSKTAWKASGGFRERGIIGVDNHYYGAIKRAGYKVYIMGDLYMYHRYRAVPLIEPVKTSSRKEGAVYCSYRIDGGGNQSGKKLAELLDYDFVNLHTEEWKTSTHKKQIWYMNDDIYKLNGKDNAEFKKVLSHACDIKVVLNFVIGGTNKADWVKEFDVSKILFLNKQRENEWEDAVRDTSAALIRTSSLCPPINIEDYKEKKERPDSPILKIGRHSRISLKYPEDPCDLYNKINSDTREFHFMLAHPEIQSNFKDAKNFKFYSWNQVPVKEYLENLDIWLCIINPKTKEQGPRTLAEAMAAGCVCIAEDRDGPTDKIINGVTGFLVKSQDEVPELLDRLEADKDLRQRISTAAREYALKNFHYDKWIEELKYDAT